MIIEILQFLSMLMYYKIHLLILFFFIFVVSPAVIIKNRSRKYRVHTGESVPVTVIVPVHLEDYTEFEKCLSSIQKELPDQVIVSIDSEDAQLMKIAETYGAEIISYPKRVGKRQAIADAWLKAKNDIVVHVDSDVVLDKDCLKEITKPFSDKNVAGVSTHHATNKNGSRLAFVLSSLIEQNMNVNGKALDGGLVVVDGRCNAWRKNLLLSLRDKFLNDYWMGIRSEIGDDRFLSREALKQGFKTAYQETAKIFLTSPSTFANFIGQQIRWRRSGTKFWLKDLKEGVRPNKTYTFKCSTYYTSPFIFILAVILDMLYFKLPFHLWTPTWWISLIVIVIGCSSVTLLRQLIYFGRALFPAYLVLQALLGLLIMLPASIYGALTVRKQNLWLTRKYNSTMTDGGQNTGGIKLLGVMLLMAGIAIVVAVWSIYILWVSETEYL